MAVLAKPIKSLPIIKKENTETFLEEFNQNKVSNDFLKSCKKASKLFEIRSIQKCRFRNGNGHCKKREVQISDNGYHSTTKSRNQQKKQK